MRVGFTVEKLAFRLRGRNTLIQNLRLSSTDLKAIKRQSAAHMATLSCSTEAIGLAPGFNSLMKNSLNV